MSALNEPLVRIGTVMEVENDLSVSGSCASRVKVRLDNGDTDNEISDYPWCFPLLPKTVQSIPKIGESVFVFTARIGDVGSQRYYIGPIITQPQYFSYTPAKIARTMFETAKYKPLPKISNNSLTDGSFPSEKDVAIIGRGEEDIALKYDDHTRSSEVSLRAGIRGPIYGTDDKTLIGNVVFNGKDPAYVQVKRKQGIAEGATSFVNIVANKVNIMSNKDTSVSHNLGDSKTLVNEEEFQNVMDSLHQVPLGDKLYELLVLMRGAILSHVHPFPGMPQCGDSSGYIDRLKDYDMNSILSDYVRIS